MAKQRVHRKVNKRPPRQFEEEVGDLKPPAVVPPSFGDRFNELAQIHEDRANLYGDDYLRAGTSLAAIFPQGVVLRTAEDFNRLALFIRVHDKLLRYANCFDDGGHQDSLDDISIYAQLLRHADEVRHHGRSQTPTR
jgi:hypothetical protein